MVMKNQLSAMISAGIELENVSLNRKARNKLFGNKISQRWAGAYALLMIFLTILVILEFLPQHEKLDYSQFIVIGAVGNFVIVAIIGVVTNSIDARSVRREMAGRDRRFAGVSDGALWIKRGDLLYFAYSHAAFTRVLSHEDYIVAVMIKDFAHVFSKSGLSSSGEGQKIYDWLRNAELEKQSLERRIANVFS